MRKGVIHSASEGPPINNNLRQALCGCLPHRSPPSLRRGFPRLIEKSSQLWERRAVEDAMPGEEGGAVELECQECCKGWLRPGGGWELCR